MRELIKITVCIFSSTGI